MLLKPRIIVSLAIAAAAAMLSAVTGVPAAAASVRTVIEAEVPFACTTSSGTQRIDVQLEAAGPAAGQVGQPVQLGTVAIRMDVPAELIGGSAAAGAGDAEPPVAPGVPEVRDVTGTARLDVSVVAGNRVLNSGWPVIALAADAPPDGPANEAGDEVRLVGHGVVSPVVPTAAGNLTWRAGALALSLEGLPGDAADPVPVNCAPPRDAEIGKVAVGEMPRASAAAPAPGGGAAALPAQAAGGDLDCWEIPPPGEDPRYALNADPKLSEVFEQPPRPETGIVRVPAEGYAPGLPYCARGAGFANIKKLDGAAPIASNSVFRRGVVTYRPDPPTTGTNYLEQQGYVLNATAPSRTTLLSLGFMPTTAIAEAVQVEAPGDPVNRDVGNMRIIAPLQPPQTRPPGVDSSNAWIRAYVAMRVKDASINGTPLNMGDECTSGRTLLSVSSFMGSGETGIIRPDDGQTFSGDLDIPRFSGCGSGEDLSPLLTASISGSGNYVRLESGPWCRPSETRDCNADPEEPQTWSITPGGDVVATAEPFVIQGLGQAQVRCDAATMRFDLPRNRWIPRFMLAEITPSFRGCTLRNSAGAESDVELTSDLHWWMHGAPIVDGNITLDVNGLLLNAAATVDGQRCNIRFGQIPVLDMMEEVPGSMNGPYRDGTFTGSSMLYVTNQTTCGFTSGFFPWTTGTVNAEFGWDPVQRFTGN